MNVQALVVAVRAEKTVQSSVAMLLAGICDMLATAGEDTNRQHTIRSHLALWRDNLTEAVFEGTELAPKRISSRPPPPAPKEEEPLHAKPIRSAKH